MRCFTVSQEPIQVPAKEITPATGLIRTRQLLEADVSGEIVALDVEKGQCYGLNSVGSRVWMLLAERTTISDICATLTREFDVDADTCQAEVTRLVSELQAEGLVQASG